MKTNRLIPATFATALLLACSGHASAQRAAGDDPDVESATAAPTAAPDAGRAPAVKVEKRIVRRPVIGVVLVPDAHAGVQIAGVTPESTAAKQGLKAGDRLLSVNGTPVAGVDADARMANARDLLGKLDTRAPVKIGYAREGREASISLTPQLDSRVFMWNEEDGSLLKAAGPVFIRRGDAGTLDIESDSMEVGQLGLSPGMQTEVMRISRGGDCTGDDCKAPMLAEAFRWNGLNLASVDAQLGRYFGADKGVLVLSAGQDLLGLQAGDVIRKVAGKPVTTPREAMDALRAAPAASMVDVEYLRDRQVARVQVQVPKAIPLRMLAPQALAAPGASNTVTRRKIVMVDSNGNTRTLEDDGTGPMPPMPPAPASPKKK